MPFKANVPDYYTYNRWGTPEQLEQPSLSDQQPPQQRIELPRSPTYNPFDPNTSSVGPSESEKEDHHSGQDEAYLASESETEDCHPRQDEAYSDLAPAAGSPPALNESGACDDGSPATNEDSDLLRGSSRTPTGTRAAKLFEEVQRSGKSRSPNIGVAPERTRRRASTYDSNDGSDTPTETKKRRRYSSVMDSQAIISSDSLSDNQVVHETPLHGDLFSSQRGSTPKRSSSVAVREAPISNGSPSFAQQVSTPRVKRLRHGDKPERQAGAPMVPLATDGDEGMEPSSSHPMINQPLDNPSSTAFEGSQPPGIQFVPETPQYDSTTSFEIYSQPVNIHPSATVESQDRFKMPSQSADRASDDGEAEELAASVLETIRRKMARRPRADAEETLEKARIGGSSKENSSPYYGPLSGQDNLSHRNDNHRLAPYIHTTNPRHVLQQQRTPSGSVDSLSEHTNYELPQVLHDYGLPARWTRRSPSPLARVQRLPTGRRVLQELRIPSRAPTPDEADQAFVESKDVDNQRLAGHGRLSRTASPLTDPPEYFDGRSTPDLNFRISRQGISALCWSRWDQEGFGDQEKENTHFVRDFSYNKRSDYPPGISTNYLGARVGKGGDFPAIQITTAKQLLGFQDERSQDIYNNFIRDITSHLVVNQVEKKTTNPEAWRAVMRKITRSKHLAPSVRRDLINGPMDAETGELLWTQNRRCYWHAIDTIAQQQAKTIRQSLKLGREQAKALHGRDSRW